MSVVAVTGVGSHESVRLIDVSASRPLSAYSAPYYLTTNHGNQLKSKNRRFPQTNLLCRATIPKWIAILQFRYQKIK